MISGRQSRSSLDWGAMNVDSTEVVIGDEGNVRLARGVCGKPKICFVDHQAHALCLDKISQSSPYSVTDDVVVGCWRWRQKQFSLIQFMPDSLLCRFLQFRVLLKCELGGGTHCYSA